MGKTKPNIPRSFRAFYWSLLCWSLTEGYSAMDNFLTFIAIILFIAALFNRELAHQMEAQWNAE